MLIFQVDLFNIGWCSMNWFQKVVINILPSQFWQIRFTVLNITYFGNSKKWREEIFLHQTVKHWLFHRYWVRTENVYFSKSNTHNINSHLNILSRKWCFFKTDPVQKDFVMFCFPGCGCFSCPWVTLSIASSQYDHPGSSFFQAGLSQISSFCL